MMRSIIAYQRVTLIYHRLVKNHVYSKTYVKRPFLKRPKIGFQDQLSQATICH